MAGSVSQCCGCSSVRLDRVRLLYFLKNLCLAFRGGNLQRALSALDLRYRARELIGGYFSVLVVNIFACLDERKPRANTGKRDTTQGIIEHSLHFIAEL